MIEQTTNNMVINPKWTIQIWRRT